MSKRTTRVLVARETVAILEKGFYVTAAGERIELANWQRLAQAHSHHYRPEEFEAVFRQRDEKLRKATTTAPIQFEVKNETTLHAAQRLLDQGCEDVLCLNFASAKNPGGGFLNGSQAQEESLARATGLYPCIAQMQEMYEANRNYDSCLYTDHMIYSPAVPVFRNDEDELLNRPYRASFITAPAVNISGMQNRREAIVPEEVAQTMHQRIEKILSVAVVRGHRNLVLGAWGCGVFKNNPAEVAAYFRHYLAEDALFRHAFAKVAFAVLDSTANESTIQPFRNAFLK